MKIVIVGAGRFGSNLFRRLEADNDVVIVDSDEEKCEQLASETSAIVLNGDIRNPDILDEINLQETDVLIAVTGHDETNFLAASYAKKRGVNRVIARTAQEEYKAIMKDLGIEPFIPTEAASEKLALSISRPIIHHLVAGGVGNFKIFDLTVEEEHLDIIDFPVKDAFVGLTVDELPSEEMYQVMAILREGKFILPKPSVQLQENDFIVVLCEADKLEQVIGSFE